MVLPTMLTIQQRSRIEQVLDVVVDLVGHRLGSGWENIGTSQQPEYKWHKRFALILYILQK